MIALPNPQIILPIIIKAKAPGPFAPACIAAPTHVTTVPVRAEYLLPRRSLIGRGEEDITRPRAQVVDCCYETLLRGRWLRQGLNEAGRDIDGREDTDVVSTSSGEYDTERSPENTN